MQRKYLKGFGILLLVLAALFLLGQSRAGVNAWFLLTDSVYVIPAGSSLFSFAPTVMNPGSGDWWLYGEDRDYFYHFTGEMPYPVERYSREQAVECPGFETANYATWCVGRGKGPFIK